MFSVRILNTYDYILKKDVNPFSLSHDLSNRALLFLRYCKESLAKLFSQRVFPAFKQWFLVSGIKWIFITISSVCFIQINMIIYARGNSLSSSFFLLNRADNRSICLWESILSLACEWGESAGWVKQDRSLRPKRKTWKNSISKHVLNAVVFSCQDFWSVAVAY